MNFEVMVGETVLSVSLLMERCGLSKSQINRKIQQSKNLRRSLDAKGQYLAHISTIKEKCNKEGIAFIGGHVFSSEVDIISAMLKSIRESSWGRKRQSFLTMFRYQDLGKSFRKLEVHKDTLVIKLGKQYLYVHKDKKAEQIQNYLKRKGRKLISKDEEIITIALIFSVIKYDNLDAIERGIRKERKNGGRKPFPFRAMINGVLYRYMKKISSFAKVSDILNEDSNLAVALGFDIDQGTPSSCCFTRFIQQVGKHVRNNVNEKLAELLEKRKELNKKKKAQTEKKSKTQTKKKTVPANKRNFINISNLEEEVKRLKKKQEEFEDEVSDNGWYHIFADFVSQLLALRVIEGKIVCLDATHLNASRKDPNQSYGVKRTRKLKDGTTVVVKDFFGYKLHIAVDAKTNLPVAITITTGCVADNKEAPKIIRQLKRHGIFFNLFLADGGYNDKKIYREIKVYNKDAKYISPANEHEGEPLREYYYDEKRRERYKIYYNTEDGKKLFRLRGPTENINKIIKNDLDMDKPKTRGIRAIESLAYIHCVVVLILAIAAKLTNREHLINQFSKVV